MNGVLASTLHGHGTLVNYCLLVLTGPQGCPNAPEAPPAIFVALACVVGLGMPSEVRDGRPNDRSTLRCQEQGGASRLRALGRGWAIKTELETEWCAEE
jgi:hypothetical protein